MPSKTKKINSKKQKSKIASAKRSRTKKAVKPARPKRTTKKKQAKKKSTKARIARQRGIRMNDARRLESARRKQEAISGGQSEDFQGLSHAEQADSESVEELVEEGNIFEAGAVAGVEEADNAGEREVHTKEIPEDDVPEEYLDKD